MRRLKMQRAWLYPALLGLLIACPCSSQTASASPEIGRSITGNKVEQVCLSEILIRTAPPYGKAQIISAKRRAEALRNTILSGIAFADVARITSNGPSASQGGGIGCFHNWALAHPLEELVFRMKIGEVSSIVATKLGFVILQVTDAPAVAEIENQNSRAANSSGLRGTVVLKFAHVPIRGAYILIHPDGGGGVDVHAFTDANGKYAVQLPLGIYDVLISGRGLSPMTRKFQVTPDGMMILDAALEVNDLGMEHLSAAR
jgi:hypothetical protein